MIDRDVMRSDAASEKQQNKSVIAQFSDPETVNEKMLKMQTDFEQMLIAQHRILVHSKRVIDDFLPLCLSNMTRIFCQLMLEKR